MEAPQQKDSSAWTERVRSASESPGRMRGFGVGLLLEGTARVWERKIAQMTRGLYVVLLLKISATIALWCGPPLLLPIAQLEHIGFPVGQTGILFRLLGMAYGSLLVNYAFALGTVHKGGYPRSTVWTGIVSNCGAFLLLAFAAVEGTWASWGQVARIFMWTSLIATGLISAGLLVFGPYAHRLSAK